MTSRDFSFSTEPRSWPKVAAITGVCAFVTVLMFLITFGLFIAGEPIDSYTPQNGFAAGYLVLGIPTGIISLIALAILLRRARHATTAGFVAMIGSIGALGSVAAIVAVFSLVGAMPRRVAIWATALFTGGLLIDTAIQASAPQEKEPLFLLSSVALFTALIVALAWLRRARLDKRRTALIRARQEERHRISRDMHDSLAHRLSLIAVHSGALEYRNDLNDDDRREAAHVIRSEADAAVGDLQSVLRALRGDGDQEATDPRDSVIAVVEQAQQRDEKIELNFDDERTAQEMETLSNFTRHTVNRTLQEALTNARKHAPGAPVSVTLCRNAQDLILTVSNPVAHHQSEHADGFGLTGLKERAALTGGRLTVEGGDLFTVTLVVPWA